MSKHHHAEHTKTEKERKNPAFQAEETAVGPEDLSEKAPESSKAAETSAENAAQGEAETRETGFEKAETESAGAEDQVPVQPRTPEDPEDRTVCLEAKLAEANDQYLRKAAEFENFRKRMNQEKQNAIDFANQNLLLDLISVIDDFERAIKAAETQREAAGQDPEQISASFNGLYEGISMIEKRLVSQLENKWGLKRFDSAGEPFDPNRHEAIMMEKSAEITDPVVQEDFIKGYTLKERVVRAAKVKVLMPENA
ncbi:MAG: nucleotide exchange factor GrpE [Treponema sp.]|jgi:molecular chaperone GrpE|nr:nucleotide exchange factor GrpE [Treponema sp.]